MHAIITEVVVALGKEKTVIPNYGAVLRVEDEGAGPFLTLEAHNCGSVPRSQQGLIVLETHEEIDRLAAELHAMMRQAQDDDEEGDAIMVDDHRKPCPICEDGHLIYAGRGRDYCSVRYVCDKCDHEEERDVS